MIWIVFPKSSHIFTHSYMRIQALYQKNTCHEKYYMWKVSCGKFEKMHNLANFGEAVRSIYHVLVSETSLVTIGNSLVTIII